MSAPFGQPAQQLGLLRDFVQIAPASADARAVNLPGDAENRRVDGVGAGESRAGVQQSPDRAQHWKTAGCPVAAAAPKAM